MDPRDPALWMWAEARRVLDEADRLRQQFFRIGAEHALPSWEPPADVYETDGAWWLQIALPGVAPERIRYSLTADTLHVVAERALPAQCAQGAIHRMEIPQGRFERRIRFPQAPSCVMHAEVRDGCLWLALRKS